MKPYQIILILLCVFTLKSNFILSITQQASTVSAANQLSINILTSVVINNSSLKIKFINDFVLFNNPICFVNLTVSSCLVSQLNGKY